ncbi:hypothetical protein H257_02340 [Aphanomyces astaci]|uniref:Methyltransferase-like protein 4 n=1 Tax=Aphanomyces astaci TaxID=112090 RepID=W4H1I0_APHAT|nr:hypothetical protein H257_02340 [Aphanomyces astaci]ETV85757.1 hypothetical protein H257_02340 [Aphanomyces astaci]RQM27568.1 hypothetical protein B5M09_007024 [Aphanomyces astaci]|eukprot:XP_009824229.1 hypothetical protein H257_02340 [Aphanomyces astaci]
MKAEDPNAAAASALDATSAAFEVVHHLDTVNAYYNSFRVAAASLRVSHVAYIQESSSINLKKRKRKASPASLSLRLPSPDLLAKLEAVRRHALPSVPTLLPPYINLATSTTSSTADPPPTKWASSHTSLASTFMDGLQENTSDDDTLIMHANQQYILPRHSAFVLGDVFRLPPLPSIHRFIVMDPPWENKTVARGSTYTTMPHTRLVHVDIPALAHPDGCLLAIWVTNKPTYSDFIRQTLLPRWGFAYLQTWHWLKVAGNGDCVTPLSSSHKLPFEKVLLAGRGSFACTSIPDKVLVSVPLRHSWKPPLLPSVAPFGIDEKGDAKLEIFARELRPHWTCVGNEVLKFQHMTLFELNE